MGRQSDLVLEGGGVRGIALVGAVLQLADVGYRFPRVAGTSAGAMSGALVAALQRRGESLDALAEIALTLDYTRFRDRGRILDKLDKLGPLGLLADGVSLLTDSGIYEGDYLHDWMSGVLADLGVQTFGDLRIADAGGDDAIHHRYGLVVTASDVSRRRFVRLPWDYAEYGLDPDEQRVADAVRASASIPFFFEPVTLQARDGVATLVDGGVLSNYPIGIFDRLDEQPPRWPTLGVRLSSTGSERPVPTEPVEGPVALALALLDTLLDADQATRVSDPCNVGRSIFVDTSEVAPTDFDVTPQQREELVAAGRAAADRFLTAWDYPRWLRECRGVEAS